MHPLDQKTPSGSWRRTIEAVALAMTASAILALLSGRSVFYAESQSFDSMLYVRSLWGIAHGESINSVVGVHALSIHGTFGLFLLAPFARAFGSAATLVASQAIAFGLTAFLVLRSMQSAASSDRYGIANAQRYALVASILFLVSPWFTNSFLFDLRPEMMAVPVGTFACLRIAELGRWDRTSSVAFVLCVLMREEFAFLLASVAVLAPLSDAKQRRPLARVLIAALAVSYWATYFVFGREWIGGDYAFQRVADAPATLFGSPSASLFQLFRFKLEILLAFVLCTGGLVLLAWRWLLVGVPTMMLVLVMNRMQSSVLNFHYSMFAIPIIATASVEGFRIAGTSFPLVRRKTLYFSLLFFSAFTYVVSSAAPFGGRFREQAYGFDFLRGPISPVYDWDRQEQIRMHEAASRVRAHDSVVAPYQVGARLAERKEIHLLQNLRNDFELERPEWESDAVLLPFDGWQFTIRNLVEMRSFEPSYLRDTVVLLQQNASVPWNEVARAKLDGCEASNTRWSEYGMRLCKASRFRDGRLSIVVQRYAEASASASNRTLFFRGRSVTGDATYDFSLLRGLVNLRGLPVGRAARLLADGPTTAVDLVITIESEPRIADDANRPNHADLLPIHFSE